MSTVRNSGGSANFDPLIICSELFKILKIGKQRQFKYYGFFVCLFGVYRPTREFFTHNYYGKLKVMYI